MANDKKFMDYIKKEMKSKDLNKVRLAIIDKYLGNTENSIQILRSITSFEMSDEVKITGVAQKDTGIIIEIGQDLLKTGIELNLARWRNDDARQFFVWAAEKCAIPENTFKEWSDIEQFDLIAVGYLWRGYALLILGKYDEAFELLRQVPVYFNKEKLTGSEVWQIYEPNLVKALLPLCEYKLNPIEENRERARKGLEEFIRGLKEPKFKLEGFLYYYHLKEMFPEIYSEKPPALKPVKEAVNPVFEPSSAGAKLKPSNIKGTVFVSDSDRCHIWAFGTVDDLLRYTDMVKNLGCYPLLSSLMDVYEVEVNAGLEPRPLLEECERLLSVTNDFWIINHTKSIQKIAEKALSEDLGVILYLEPDIE